MKAWRLALGPLAAVLFVGCEPASRYAVLSTFFDGVPKPVAITNGPGNGDKANGSTVAQLRRAKFGEHGPYAARQCDACHASTASNTFVAPRDQLCLRCHDLQLNKRYIHGPLASGGCISCHDPHSSKYEHLLVSDSGTFCLHCHNTVDIAKVSAHRETKAQCTSCHDPHMSDRKYLVR